MPIIDPHARDPLGWSAKGIPRAAEGLAAPQLKRAGLRLFSDDLMFPVAVLKRSAMEANRSWMRQFLERTGLALAPHGKTTMAPEIFRLQMADGGWAMTAATASHVRIYRKCGVNRIVLANQLIGQANIDYVIDELEADEGFEFFCFVDSIAAADALACRAAVKAMVRPFNVLIEIGRDGGRSGVRGVAQAVGLASALRERSRHLVLVGVATYEGITQTLENACQEAERMIDMAVDAVRDIDQAGLFAGGEIVLTAGGSAFLDIVARRLSAVVLSRAVCKVLRAGCYIIYDDGLYAQHFAALRRRNPDLGGDGAGLHPALEVWGHVLSMPEPGRMICGLGKRDIGADDRLPEWIAWARPGEGFRLTPRGGRVVTLYDQHLVVDGPGTWPLQVGDLVGFSVSHPCTTLDKWKTLLVVDDGYVVQEAIRTYF